MQCNLFGVVGVQRADGAIAVGLPGGGVARVHPHVGGVVGGHLPQLHDQQGAGSLVGSPKLPDYKKEISL